MAATGGADLCENAVAVPVPLRSDGKESIATLEGNNSEATGFDCDFLGDTPAWWEAFEVGGCADVLLELCDTDPVQRPSFSLLYSECGCIERWVADRAARGAPVCDNANVWLQFNALPAGTYYYPVYSDVRYLQSGLGDYALRVHATPCLGACCSAEGGCVDDLTESECAAAHGLFLGGLACCEAECKPSGVGFDSRGVQLMSHLAPEAFPGGSEASDLWGYVSPRGREYAIIGLTNGTGFVDITRPREAFLVEFIDGEGIDSSWRDVAVRGEFAYIVTDGIGVGLQVVDMSRIDEGIVERVNTTDLGVFFATAHNVFVNPDSGVGYLVLTNAPSYGLVALDMSDPVHPTVAGHWDDAPAHDVQVVSGLEVDGAPREIAFVFCGGEGLFIVDVTDKANMTTLSRLEYDTLGYCHQGWLDAERRLLFMNDEYDELLGLTTRTTTYVVDVSDLLTPQVVRTFGEDTCAIDHNLMLQGRYVYEANYSLGLRVFDASNALDIQPVGYFDTFPGSNVQGFFGAWGVFSGFPSGFVAVSDINRGLFVLGYDCDNNGVSDAEELEDPGGDCNGNLVLDACEFLKAGDLTLDRRVAVPDALEHVGCLSGPGVIPGGSKAGGVPEFPVACCRFADRDGDTDVDLADAAVAINAATASIP